MIILPAIDIRMGRVVRLLQGDFTKETVYSGDPVNMAKKWEKDGAAMLHIVDLDGAYLGKLKNLPIIKELVSAIKIPVELGGGLRTEGEVDNAISCGIKKVVIGTRAYTDENFIKKLVRKYRDAVIVAVDAAGGEIISEGWKRQTSIKAKDFIEKLCGFGIETVIYTDILKDGTMKSPNMDSIKEILDSTTCRVIISGGISCLDDIKNLVALNRKNLAGVIVGKALYEGVFTLQEANKIV
ncbi:MAG: 1-(5-phosphoribosyl)-5-[(5-phosphoribosylamino)methylideneamino]imidazole-4-carboxamide isomerase [Candidatus Omnitrophica bacterium]|nr:1-(5-phosphoribosyl)-5-[(5-phosphoribosylamino)methylideneamino]imidazole-4-carboxamide isomerase [Candidatus Omnitrophota bacterium]